MSEPLFAGKDVLLTLMSELLPGGTQVTYDLGNARDAEVIKTIDLIRYLPLGKDNPKYIEGTREYQFRFESAFINTAILRFFSGYLRGTTTEVDWSKPLTAGMFQEGLEELFNRYPNSALGILIDDGAGTYQHAITLGDLHPSRVAIRAQSGQTVTVDMTGYAQKFQAGDILRPT